MFQSKTAIARPSGRQQSQFSNVRVINTCRYCNEIHLLKLSLYHRGARVELKPFTTIPPHEINYILLQTEYIENMMGKWYQHEPLYPFMEHNDDSHILTYGEWPITRNFADADVPMEQILFITEKPRAIYRNDSLYKTPTTISK